MAPAQAAEDWQRYIAVAEQLPTEHEWVRLAQQHLRKVLRLGRNGT